MAKPISPENENRERVRQYIKDYWTEHHYSPSFREIRTALALSSGTVTFHLSILEREGWLEPIRHGDGKGTGLARVLVPAEIFADRPVFPDHLHFELGTIDGKLMEVSVVHGDRP